MRLSARQPGGGGLAGGHLGLDSRALLPQVLPQHPRRVVLCGRPGEQDCATKQVALWLVEAQCCIPGYTSGTDCDELAADGWAVQDLDLETCSTRRRGPFIPPGIGERRECYGPYCGGNDDGGTDDDGIPDNDPRDSPIVLRLGPGLPRLSAAADGVVLPVLRGGRLARFAWPADEKTAFLVLDRDGNGTIDHFGEMFGNYTRLANGSLAEHGFVALAELDGNGDGWLDDGDEAYSHLRLWLDADRNGLSSPSELRTLAELRVDARGTNARSSRRKDAHGNEFRFRARVVSGTPGLKHSWDVFLTSLPVAGLTTSPTACGGSSRPQQTSGRSRTTSASR